VPRQGSDVFLGVIEAARKQLLIDHENARSFENSGIIGDERAAALADFLRSRLPEAYGVAKGEIIDCFDNRTGQIDLFIFDRLAAKPISQQRENALVPCEALYAVIEVKSTFTREEARRCLHAAARLRRLRPFKEHFVDARTHGARAQESEHRAMYVVFAYTTDLRAAEWMAHEHQRLLAVAAEEKVNPSVIDRIFVADRGILNPIRSQGKLVQEDAEYLFVEFFLHLINFIDRERARRPLISWRDYALPKSKGWKPIRSSGPS
jgi:hypothetical protein